MERLVEYVYRRFAESILLWDTDDQPDVYAISFSCDFSRPHRSCVWLVYNTETLWRESIDEYSTEEDARWCADWWLIEYQCGLFIHPDDDDELADPEGIALRDQCLAELGLFRTEAQVQAMFKPDPAEDYEEWGNTLANRLLRVYIEVAKQLHQTGILVAKFGRPVPILIHDLEYNEWSANATREANPVGLTTEFEEWVKEACQ